MKDSNATNGAAGSNAPSQNSESKSGPSPRSNPVCLEVGVTVRSLPSEEGGLIRPIREEVRTVIVFDNGAVLRSSIHVSCGQKVILSNQAGRDVVCRVVAGQNASVKGYIELEFMETVNDFWGIRKGADQAAVPPQAAPALSLPEALKEQASPSPESPLESPDKVGTVNPAIQPSGSAPTFEDIAGVVRMSPRVPAREAKLNSTKPETGSQTKGDITRDISEPPKPGPVTAPRLANADPGKMKSAIPAMKEAAQAPPPQVRAGDFMGNELLASDQPRSSTNTRNRRMLLIVAAVLVLSVIGAGVYVMHRGSAPDSAPNGTVVSEEATSVHTPAQTASAPVQSAQQANSQLAVPVQPAVAAAPIPPADGRPAMAEAGRVQQQGKNTDADKQPDLAASRILSIPKLKMKSPVSPRHKVSNPGEMAAPETEISPSTVENATPGDALLISASRTLKPPVSPLAPAPAPVSKTSIDAKLISSTRPVYPAAAKESNIQGNVVVQATVDERGNVAAVKALSGPMFLRQAALDSVKQWKYSPASVDGNPVSSQVTVNLEFRLK